MRLTRTKISILTEEIGALKKENLRLQAANAAEASSMVKKEPKNLANTVDHVELIENMKKDLDDRESRRDAKFEVLFMKMAAGFSMSLITSTHSPLPKK